MQSWKFFLKKLELVVKLGPGSSLVSRTPTIGPDEITTEFRCAARTYSRFFVHLVIIPPSICTRVHDHARLSSLLAYVLGQDCAKLQRWWNNAHFLLKTRFNGSYPLASFGFKSKNNKKKGLFIKVKSLSYSVKIKVL